MKGVGSREHEGDRESNYPTVVVLDPDCILFVVDA